jgi:hypothetical protein
MLSISPDSDAALIPWPLLEFSRATALALVESCWELIADDPDV